MSSPSLRTALVFEMEAVAPISVIDPDLGDGRIARRRGEPEIPVSTLSGSLREHLAELGIDQQLMGSPAPPPGERPDDHLVPSKLWLLGSRTSPTDGKVESETRTAIDRVRRAPRSAKMFTAEHLPVGTTVTLYGLFDGELSESDLAGLKSWRPLVGRANTSGFGDLHIKSLLHGPVDLSRPDHRRTWMTQTGTGRIRSFAVTPLEPPSTSTEEDGVRSDELDVWNVTCRVVDSVLIAPRADETPDDTAATLENGGAQPRTRKSLRRVRLISDPNGSGNAESAVGERYVIPGSSLKGVFRSRIEFMCRSVGIEACRGDDEPCGRCVPCWLFGSAERRGRLRFHTAELSGAEPRNVTRVAIDRVTGGARDGNLFTTESIAGEFNIHITNPSRLGVPEEALKLVREVLGWVLLDLHEGFIGLGGTTSRGAGTICLMNPTALDGLGSFHEAAAALQAMIDAARAADAATGSGSAESTTENLEVASTDVF